ncbi:MAG: thiolase family protein [Pseudomonadota bacterium]
MGKGDFAVIGTSEVPHGIFPERSEYEIAYTVARAAVKDAGIEMKDIGAVLSAAHIMGSEYNTEIFFGHLPEAIGAKNAKFYATTVSGGGSSSSIIKTAAGVIESGVTDTVLVIHAQRFSQFSGNEQAKYFAHAGSSLEWEVPYGMTYNGLAAMMANAYMEHSGTSIRQIAAVSVACRKWACLQPNAMFNKKELTIEDVLNSKMVAAPLTAFMCNVLCDGGSAYVICSAEKARKIAEKTGNKPVYILGSGSRFSHRFITSAVPDFADMGKMYKFFTPPANEAYNQAGLGPKDMDIFQAYGAYPHLDLILLEAMGLAEPGKAGALVETGETSPGGKYPATTNGEALSFGHTGTGVGFSLWVETIRQLQGKAGKAQVPNAKFAIFNSGGGAYSDIHYTVLGNEVS